MTPRTCVRCGQAVLVRHKDCRYCKDKQYCHGCGKVKAGVRAVMSCLEFPAFA